MNMDGSVGKKFNMLTVVSVDLENKTSKYKLNCVCDCGNHAVVDFYHVTRGRTKSCGCLVSIQARKMVESHRTHSMSKRHEYRTWSRIKSRCYDENFPHYENYGGRGIKVCDRWLSSFENFFEDMGQKPTASHSIDRVDVDGDYSPSNCRWATIKEQANNKRGTKFIEHNGQSMTANDWSLKMGLTRDTVGRRIRNGWPIAEAIETPSGQRGKVGCLKN